MLEFLDSGRGTFVADAVTGFDIAEQNGPAHAIERVATGIAAFVGRTLKGPVNVPVVVHSFAEYSQVFGGLWQPSMVAYAVEQYFENGGREAIVVRVTNGGRPPSLSLRAGTGELRLTGIAPGSREYLRASVDYDGIGSNEPEFFNLVLQRVRTPGSELVEDQEIFRRVSIREGGERDIVSVLLESRLARIVGSLPNVRPDRTPAALPTAVIGYVSCNADGDDGDRLSDYDVIGSGQNATGLHALKNGPRFDLLCLPAHTRTHDVGLPVLLVAARMCRERHAMLLVDPPSEWTSAAGALTALRGWPFRSDHAVMFYPRVLAFDRLRGRFESFGSAAAAAGLIARNDGVWPVWAAAESEDSVLRPGLRLACTVSDSERSRLGQSGVNTLQAVRVAARPSSSARTLAAGGSGPSDWTYLSARRLASFITASVERGTRWLVFDRERPDAWLRARAQVVAFLEALDQEGAFVGRTPGESYFVICDDRLNARDLVPDGRVNLLFGFAPTRPGEFHAFLVTHCAGSSRVRPVSVNRMATSSERVEEEIETGILRGLALHA